MQIFVWGCQPGRRQGVWNRRISEQPAESRPCWRGCWTCGPCDVALPGKRASTSNQRGEHGLAGDFTACHQGVHSLCPLQAGPGFLDYVHNYCLYGTPVLDFCSKGRLAIKLFKRPISSLFAATQSHHASWTSLRMASIAADTFWTRKLVRV